VTQQTEHTTRTPTRKGNIAEAAVTLALIRNGYSVLIPVGDGHRYDLVTEDDNGVFQRVQVKMGRLRNGAIIFNTESTRTTGDTTGGVRIIRQSYIGQIDVFAVYCPELDKTYLISPEACAAGRGSLRVEATRNGQSKGVCMAEAYELR